MATPLFPVAQRSDTDTYQMSKFILGETEPFAQSPDLALRIFEGSGGSPGTFQNLPPLLNALQEFLKYFLLHDISSRLFS